MSPLEDARQMVAEALQVDPAVVGADTGALNTEAWDSIVHINIMLALEERAGGAIPHDRVAGLLSVAAIADFLASIPAGRPAAHDTSTA